MCCIVGENIVAIVALLPDGTFKNNHMATLNHENFDYPWNKIWYN